VNNGENQLSGIQGLKITLSKFRSAKVMSVKRPKAEVAGEARSERQQSIEAYRNKAAICARKNCSDGKAGSVKGHAI
jgi:hypothetical protein